MTTISTTSLVARICTVLRRQIGKDVAKGGFSMAQPPRLRARVHGARLGGRPPALLGVAAVACLALTCTPSTTEAANQQSSGDAAPETKQVALEAFVVEAQKPIFDASYKATAAAARGQGAELLPGYSGASLAERVRAAEKAGALVILAAPHMVVLSGEGASTQSGLQIPVQTVSNDTVSVQYVNATLSLRVKPEVRSNGKIALRVDAQKRFPTKPVSGAPGSAIQTTEASTEAIVADGGTTMVSGVFQTEGARDDTLKPIQGKELVVLVTPRVLDL